jgi:hypothetical protein
MTTTPNGPVTQRWYYASGKQKLGPLSFLQLKNLVIAGQLHRRSMLLPEHARQWIPASSVPGLVPAAAQNPAPATSSMRIPLPRQGSRLLRQSAFGLVIVSAVSICVYAVTPHGFQPAAEDKEGGTASMKQGDTAQAATHLDAPGPDPKQPPLKNVDDVRPKAGEKSLPLAKEVKEPEQDKEKNKQDLTVDVKEVKEPAQVRNQNDNLSAAVPPTTRRETPTAEASPTEVPPVRGHSAKVKDRLGSTGISSQDLQKRVRHALNGSDREPADDGISRAKRELKDTVINGIKDGVAKAFEYRKQARVFILTQAGAEVMLPFKASSMRVDLKAILVSEDEVIHAATEDLKRGDTQAYISKVVFWLALAELWSSVDQEIENGTNSQDVDEAFRLQVLRQYRRVSNELALAATCIAGRLIEMGLERN